MASKSILVTGCSAGGLGDALALALALSQAKHHVFATARAPSKIPEELSRLENVTCLALDVADASSVAAALKAVVAEGRGLDILINNAGVGYTMPVLDVNIDKAKQVYETNVWGVLRTVQAFADLLIASKGRVVTMSSVGPLVHTPWIAAYTSSKAAVNVFAETLRLELAPLGVSVLTIMAGVIDSKFHANDPFTLPADSRYAPIQDMIAGWASGASKPKGCSAEQFAQQVMKDVLHPGPGGMIYRGPHSSWIAAMAHYGPASMTDLAMSVGQGLKELKASVDANGAAVEVPK
ncbi:oxidoreductase [Stachybotrys elegans]|uniref:Oxidoreductase n=1 Tax=Stachybotrys elegans TaxID=80388 RepID=A0A8K0SM88_9HYPO|nr:oxidoreductase [Stachybotrys elegans]